MINTNKKGFTLVELIVVITILAILGTIGFISLQGYSSEARDSKRVTDLGQIRTGIQVYQAKNGVVPEPNDSITVGSGSTIYTIQGYAGTGTLRNIKVNDDAKDPLEENYYTYTTNGSKTKFQLLTLLENNNTAYNNVIPTTYANYETRESYSIGDQLGTLLEPTTNIPLQEIGNDIDLSVDTTEYSAVFNKNDIQALAGESLYSEIVARSNGIGSIEETYIVTFNKDGGSGGTSDIEVLYDNSMPIITIPTKNSCEFEGYYSEINGGGTKYYNFDGISLLNYNLNNDYILYANWIGCGGLIPGDITKTNTQGRWVARCDSWNGDKCTKPVIKATHVTNHWRTLWHGDLENTGRLFCFIATGNENSFISNISGGSNNNECILDRSCSSSYANRRIENDFSDLGTWRPKQALCTMSSCSGGHTVECLW